MSGVPTVPAESHLFDVYRVIQLAVAPVFLLTAVGTILGVLSGRLARIVDRTRVLLERLPATAADARRRIEEELTILLRRRRLVNLAITSGTTSALLVCVLIASAFVGYIVHVDLSILLAVLFIAAMLAFVGALVLFLREVLVAVRNLRFDVH